MTLGRVIKLGLAALVIGLTGGPSVVAQNEALQFVLDQARQRRAQQQRPRQRVVAPRPREQRAPQSTVIVRDTPEQPKVEPTTFVVVLGDSFGDQLGGGLADAFATQPEVAVVRRARPESGLVRADFHDWPKAVRDLLASDQKITFAVIQLGANDRQPIREDNVVHETGGERWREIYGQRVEAMVRSFAERRIPVFWVGMPPMQAAKYASDMMALNDLTRAHAQKAGAHFIDIWEPFVDSQGRFSAHGPDLTGQTARLRTQDGVHFTAAGARKAAHFVELELKRLMEGRPDAAVVAVPADPQPVRDLPLELQPGGVDRAIDRMVSGLPEPVGIPGLATRPPAGPIIALGRPAASPGGVLANPRDARPTGDAALLIERVFGDGRPVEAKPGRVDDFRWPR